MIRVALFLCALGICHAALADLERTSVKQSGTSGESSKIEWKRNGRLLLTQFVPGSSDADSMCLIRLGEAGTDIVVWLKAERVTSIATKRPGFLIALDDFTKDGRPDFLQVISPESSKVIDAFYIVGGMVEPLPSDAFKPDRSEFYFDQEITDFLKKKEAAPRRSDSS